MGAHYVMFKAAKDYLRRHPDAADEDVAEAAGIKLAFWEEARLIGEARKELGADQCERHEMTTHYGQHWQPGDGGNIGPRI